MSRNGALIKTGVGFLGLSLTSAFWAASDEKAYFIAMCVTGVASATSFLGAFFDVAEDASNLERDSNFQLDDDRPSRSEPSLEVSKSFRGRAITYTRQRTDEALEVPYRRDATEHTVSYARKGRASIVRTRSQLPNPPRIQYARRNDIEP